MFFILGIHFFDVFIVFNIDKNISEIIDIANPTTPPNLLGIDRRIA